MTTSIGTGCKTTALESMKSFRVDAAQVVLGSAVRRALPYVLAESELRYDPARPALLNDLVFGEIVPAATDAEPSKKNFLERLYPHADAVRLKHEAMPAGPCVAVVGNRYAPPYLIGGLTNPITGEVNGEIRGGTVAVSLFGVNAIGFVNREDAPEARAHIKIRGVVVDRRGQSLSLRRFRDVLGDSGRSSHPDPHLVVVAGHSTDAGKTTCAWSLVRELQAQSFAVTVEKKTGTACCRDWLRCFADPRIGALEHEGDEIIFAPDRFPARDFVDGVGVASDVSDRPGPFVAASVRYTGAFLAQYHPDFHVVELADGISHVSNARLLRSAYFRRHARTFVYASVPTHEAVAHFCAYLHALGYDGAQILLSGPLANEPRYETAREEITVRLGLRLCRSAVYEAGRWVPTGEELADAVRKEAAGIR
jgi:hypothetical protein